MQYESAYYGVVDFNGPYLMHHGIKGQKWGVRRFQNEDGSLTEAGKQRYAGRSDGGDYIVKKGTVSQRITMNKDEEIGSERKYVTYTDKDNDIYSGFYPQSLRKQIVNYLAETGSQYTLPDRIFETKMSTVRDLNVAGAKTYADTFMELYGCKHIRDLAGWNKSLLFNSKNVQNARNAFDYNLQRRHNKVNDEFFKRLKDKGYDAVEDQFSKKVDKTEGALIVLDPERSLKKNSIQEYTFDKAGNKTGLVDLKTGDKIRNKESSYIKKKVSKIEADIRKAKAMQDGPMSLDMCDHLATKYNTDIDEIDRIAMNMKHRKR